MSWLLDALRRHPEVAFFVTLGIGYALGRLRLGNFQLGAVTGTLLGGVLVGQLGVKVSPEVKQCFFMLFLFSIGYRCGPQFFQGLRRDGLSQAALSAIIAVTALVVAYVCALLFGYDPGTAGGLIAGAMTESATIGTTADAIGRLMIPDAQQTQMINDIPVAFAVTYLIGVVGAAWFLAQIAPKILGVDLPAACREYEEKLEGGAANKRPGIASAYHRVEFRAYRVPKGSPLLEKPVAGLLPGVRVFIERVKRNGNIIDADEGTVLQAGDVIAVTGPRKAVVESLDTLASEVEDPEILDIPVTQLDVFVNRKRGIGRTLQELSEEPFARGVYLRRIRRNRVDIPILAETRIEQGDILTLTGSRQHVDAAVAALGQADAPSDVTDMAFVAAGIVVGAFIGLPSILVGKLEIGLSLSVGVLLGGLVWGWIHSVRPLIGRIPSATLWIFESVGLTGFVAVVGLSAGPDFVTGLRTTGISLVIAGVLTVLIPNLVGVLVGHRVFRMHPGILLGVCAGAGTATPALAAVQEAAKSSIPTLGYGVSYAVGNVLLALWGTVITLLLS